MIDLESQLRATLQSTLGGEAQLRAALNAGYVDHAGFCRRCRTRDKRGVSRVMELWPSQRKLHAAIEKQRNAGKPIRGVDLKGRQVGQSVGAAAEIFHEIAFMPGQQGMCVADSYKSVSNIFGYYTQLDESYDPGALGVPKKLPTVRTVKNELIEWAGGSSMRFASADTVTVGRSMSLRYLQLEEYAFWRDASTLITGLMQCVPDDPGTLILKISTANGTGGPFWEDWRRASDPGQRGDWFALFNPWWEHPEYWRAIEDLPGFERSLSREEVELRQAFNLRLEQLNWRRWCIVNNCGGDLDRFHQEYPSTPEEAFLASGRPRFCLISLGRMVAHRNAEVGELQRIRVGTSERIVFMEHEDGRGSLQVFKRPVPNRNYVIGADPAEGIDDSGTGKDPDYSAAVVLDQDTGEQVAAFRERLEPDPFADIVCTLAEWYNQAFIVPEINSVGLAFVQGLLYRQYPTHLIYHRERDPDDRRPPMLQELGWKETSVTRQQLVSKHDLKIRELSILLHDPIAISEHNCFVIKPNGRPEHQDGAHDDTVFAAALAGVGLEVAPRIRVMFERRPKPYVDPEDEEEMRRSNGYGRRYR